MDYILAALTFGLVAGLKPGPLGVFIIHQTMSKSNRHGLVASLAPVVTDGPIILLAYLLAYLFDDIAWFISGISIVGSVYLACLAYKIYHTPSDINLGSGGDSGSSFLVAVKINFLNPAPYIFWLSIGSSYILMGTKMEALAFIVVCIFTLCCTKYIVAISIKNLGQRFDPRIYSMIIRCLSLPLLIFSIQLFYTGVTGFPQELL